MKSKAALPGGGFRLTAVDNRLLHNQPGLQSGKSSRPKARVGWLFGNWPTADGYAAETTNIIRVAFWPADIRTLWSGRIP